jgi:hypothetical protein
VPDRAGTGSCITIVCFRSSKLIASPNCRFPMPQEFSIDIGAPDSVDSMLLFILLSRLQVKAFTLTNNGGSGYNPEFNPSSIDNDTKSKFLVPRA